MKTGFIFTRNFTTSLDLKKYDFLFYSTEMTSDCLTYEEKEALKLNIVGTERINHVMNIISSYCKYLKREIYPISPKNFLKMKDHFEIDCFFIELPLGETTIYEEPTYEPYVKIKKQEVPFKPNLTNFTKFYKSVESYTFNSKFIPKSSPQMEVFNLISEFKTRRSNYPKDRTYIPPKTSFLSKYTALGVISFEQLMTEFQEEHDEFYRQLSWILYCKLKPITKYPKRDLSFQELETLSMWVNSSLEPSGDLVVAFVNSKMKELREGTLLSNRARLILSGYLIRDLKIPWYYGELVFKEYLIDMNPGINMYNWYAQSKNRFLKNYNIYRQIKTFER